MSKKLKETPEFANEADEREFWLAHDTTDYIDLSEPLSRSEADDSILC